MKNLTFVICAGLVAAVGFALLPPQVPPIVILAVAAFCGYVVSKGL